MTREVGSVSSAVSLIFIISIKMFCIELDDSDTHAAAARFNAQFDKQLIGLRELTLHLFSQTLHW